MNTQSADGTCKKNGARPLLLILGDPVIPLIALLGFLALLGWPLLQLAGAQGQIRLFCYVFLVWAVLIGFLFAMSRRMHEPEGGAALKPPNSDASEKRGAA